jgi:hypothetical protein
MNRRKGAKEKKNLFLPRSRLRVTGRERRKSAKMRPKLALSKVGENVAQKHVIVGSFRVHYATRA